MVRRSRYMYVAGHEKKKMRRRRRKWEGEEKKIWVLLCQLRDVCIYGLHRDFVFGNVLKRLLYIAL